MSDSIEAKADRYLSEARISVVSVSPRTALINVRSDNAMYLVKYQGGTWVCDCPARVVECAHIVASKKVVHAPTTAKPTLSAEYSDLDELLGLPRE